MALEKQQVAIQFKGVDTKTDAKLLAENKLTILQNGVYRNGSIQKRTGLDSLVMSTATGTAIATGQKVFSYKDELLLASKNNLYSYVTSRARWVEKGTISPFKISSQDITPGTQLSAIGVPVFYPTYQIATDIEIFVYHASASVLSSPAIYADVKDVDTGNAIVNGASIGSGESAKATVINNELYVFYIDAGTIKYRKYDRTLTTFDAPVTVVGSAVASGDSRFDVISYSGGYAIGYATTADALIVRMYNTSLVEIGVYSLSVSGIGTSGPASISLTYDSSVPRVWVNYCDPTGVGAGSCLLAATLLNGTQSVAPVLIANISGVSDLYQTVGVVNGGTYNYFIHYDTTVLQYPFAIGAGTVGAQVLISGRGTIQGKPFVVNTVTMIPVLSRTDKVIVISGISSIPYAFFSYGECDTLPNYNNTVVLSGTKLIFPGIVIRKEYATYDSTYLCKKFVIETFPTTIYNTAFANSLFITGGLISQYDGETVVEHGFIETPVIDSVVAGAAGSIPDGTYSYKAVYEWVNANGEISRSAPSSIGSITKSTATTNFIDVVVKSISFTSKRTATNKVKIVLYRTTESGTIFYRTNSFDYNTTSISAITIDDNTTDALLIQNELLYTEGGELENFPLPPAEYIVFANKRLFVNGLENGVSYAYTKEILFGEDMQFPLEFVSNLSDNSGDNNSSATGLATMDGRVFLFKRNSIFAFGGDGPLPTGEQNTFSLPQLIASDTGAEDGRGIVLSPVGIMFKSPKGVYLLTRSLDLTYKGAEVELYNSQEVTGAVMMPTENEIRFTTSSDCLVYNYYYDLWSTFTNHIAVSSTLWQNQHTHLATNGTVKVQSAGQYTDAGAAINIVMETGWIKASGIQNYQRFYRMLLLGQYYSPHTLSLQIAYDYQPYYFETKTLTPFASNTYSISSPLTGANRYNGTNDGVYQFNIHLAKQKCEAVRFKITEVNAVTFGQGWAFTDMTLQVGLKKGVFKTMPTKQG